MFEICIQTSYDQNVQLILKSYLPVVLSTTLKQNDNSEWSNSWLISWFNSKEESDYSLHIYSFLFHLENMRLEIRFS